MRQGKEAVEVWRSYFEKVLNEGGNSEDQGGGNVLGDESSWIDEGITREEVEQALGELKRRAAPGTDGLTSRNGWQQGVSGLLALPLQLVLGQWDDPHRMEECNCTHTKRRVRCVCRMNELRGISLVPVAYKAMCGIIQERLTQVVGERNLVAEEQGGFRRGRGCRDQLLTLMLLGQIKAMSKRGMFAGFINFRKAYDRVDREKLWGCLERMGLGGCVSAFLKVVYTGTRSEVKVGEEHSKPFRVACGLRQGCILSPLLFSLYINSLVNKLKRADVGVMCRGQLISALLYADDALIFAEDEELMRRGLDILAEWCEEWSVKVNVEKCGVMHLRRKGVKRSDKRFHVGGEEIKVMEEYKYLGGVVDEYLSNVRMVEESKGRSKGTK